MYLRLQPQPGLLCLAIALSLSSPAWSADLAAEAEAPRPRNSELETVKVVGEQDVDYRAKRSSTATKTDTPLIDTPQSVTVVTRELIEDQAMQGMADVVRYVPGVGMAQGEGNRDTPIFRGSGSTADLFIDGMRDDVQYFRDVYNIERAEVLKGPNAMIFGRGGSGGLLNRVSKQAEWETIREVGLQVGSWDRRRLTADVGQEINKKVAFRVNALVEDSGSFRDDVSAERRGINPTVTFLIGENSDLSLGVEHFEDERTADRGVSSYLGRPVDVDPSTFFGDPARSTAEVEADTFNALFEHGFASGANLRNRTLVGRYDKFYQNIFPGAVDAAQTVAISAYNNATTRDSVINQTDLTFVANTGAVEHTLLVGAEFSRQETDNFRETGYFSGACPGGLTTTRVPLSDPRYTGPVCFQQSVSDADNHSVARTAAVYVQDQIEFSPQWLAVIGLRHDSFEVDLHNNRSGKDLSSTDNLLSPRVGLIYKPQEHLSIYANYGIAYLPRSGEQLASLSETNAALDPEEFANLEFGAKWDIRPNLSATAAVYELQRSNVAVLDPDPNNITGRLILLDGDSQRVRGAELELSGRLTDKWKVMGGIAWQDAEITREINSSPTSKIPAGTVLAQVPRQTLSLWNRYDFSPRWGAALGVVARSAMYASTSNAVTLPGYARFDGALFWTVSERLRLQLNVENLLDREYFASAHSDTNISPGSPRAAYLGVNLSF
jgi:catecholate siderophore receptor